MVRFFLSTSLFLGLCGMSFGLVAQTSASGKLATKPSLTVTLITPSMRPMAQRLSANGTITPWAEAVVSAEVGGYRIAQLLAQVGDHVKKGQVLAKFSTETARIELELAKAQVADAEASAAEAVASAERARAIEREGFYSAAQLSQIFNAEKSAIAKVRAAKIKQLSAELALKETDVTAPDDGIVSSRTANMGAVVPQGAELFRLIRQGRLEWRAELTGSEIGIVKPGMGVQLLGANGRLASGKVRTIAPTIDPVSRIAIAYVDIAAAQAAKADLRAGGYARGEFAIGQAVATLSVPQSAVLLRDGFNYVFVLNGQNKVAQVKVQTGAHAQVEGVDWVGITQGLAPNSQVVASGAAFLADGDSVKVAKP